MRLRPLPRARIVPWCALLLAGGAGCADRRADRYVPAPDRARAALEAALQAWQGGSPPGKVDHPGGGVFLVDNCRPPGQRLRGYAVLGEAPGEGPRCFAVKLLLEGPDEEQQARFVVFGIDPLWVYRYEDYEMMIHWECGLAEREGKGGKPAGPPQ
jgi:hypothetical protein